MEIFVDILEIIRKIWDVIELILAFGFINFMLIMAGGLFLMYLISRCVSLANKAYTRYQEVKNDRLAPPQDMAQVIRGDGFTMRESD